LIFTGRGGPIRTGDPLLPKQIKIVLSLQISCLWSAVTPQICSGSGLAYETGWNHI
jgi:hypothetical protein